MENEKIQFVFEGLPLGKAGYVQNPTWAQIEPQLNSLSVSRGSKFRPVSRGEGTVRLRIEHGESPVFFQFDSVCVHAFENNYLLTYTKNHSEHDEEVYSLFNFPERAGKSMVWMGVEHFDPSMVGHDVLVVLKAFKEFFDTGKIDFQVYGVA